MTMANAVQDYARALALRSPDHYRVGPFTVRHNPGWELKYANYAIPDRGAEPTADDVAALVDAFGKHERLPRLEFLPAWAPAVEPALLAAGFTVENRAPLLACGPEDLRPPKPVDGLRIGTPVTEAEFTGAARVQHQGFGGEGEPDSGATDWLRAAATGDGVAALAVLDGAPHGCRRLLGRDRRPERTGRTRRRRSLPSSRRRGRTLGLADGTGLHPGLPDGLAGARRCRRRAGLRGHRLPPDRREGQHLARPGRMAEPRPRTSGRTTASVRPVGDGLRPGVVPSPTGSVRAGWRAGAS